MELPTFTLSMIQGYLICLARVGAMVAAIPVFNGGQVPPQLRLGIVVLISLVVYPAVSGELPGQIFLIPELGVLLAKEVILGLLVGFLAQLIFMAAEFAGSVIGYQMGFAAANVFDPTTQRQVALISQFQGVFAILLFLALDVHHLFLEAIVSSFQMLPPGTLNLSGGAVPMLMDVANHSLILSVQLVTPILTLLILSSLVLGIMSRVFPQLNVFMLSFPINIGVSFLVMGLTLGVFASLLSKEFSLLADRFLQLFNLL
ncbi:flagellar biosynthetic protein FliR [Malonomonas rubra DSM 5091]|uniref:Flagellar biosynthetic protein FliR n=1 Tax=Malonomonas rubra DSM 5091 TaxID=1122189 RepID=A0A1M6MBQ5_MALRU|nr:flagellar biosynthetic protein FliR [Malonomonas rubra]SHJ80891.1 flagellar biosynthetic protein FliR [Malonomonas rubra DSM 5091]